jgi:hypothetical protein
LTLDWKVVIRHTYREANFVVDALANVTCDNGSEFIVYDSCLSIVRNCFQTDFLGVFTPRLVALYNFLLLGLNPLVIPKKKKL